MSEDKVLPKDIDSDYSLPGRYEESNFTYEQPVTSYEDTPRSKSRGLAIGVIKLLQSYQQDSFHIIF